MATVWRRLAEGLAIAGLSFLLGCMLSIPLTLLVGGIVGRLGFLAALPLVLSPEAAVVWIVVGTAATFAATVVPARRASALVMREALGRT